MRRSLIAVFAVAWSAVLLAQGPAPIYSPSELERIVAPVALYPDPLLANVLTAATFPEDVPDAARWADEHHHLSGLRLTAAIAADDVPWDPSVQALLPFPSVLEMMENDMPWTTELGEAFLANPGGLMAAVQRLRQTARNYGYLRGCRSVVVSSGPYVEIMPLDPEYITVPFYFPKIVFQPPMGPIGFEVYCGFGIRLGAWFRPWGWGGTRILWPGGTVIIGDAPWLRTWTNRESYRHPFPLPHYDGRREPERHREEPRNPRERAKEQPKGTPTRAAPPNREPQKASPPNGTPPERKRKP